MNLSSIGNSLFKSEAIHHLKRLFGFLKQCRIKVSLFILSVVLSLGLTLLTIYGVSLLFPLIEGIIKSDFSHVRNLEGVSYIISHAPDLFTTSTRLFIFLIVWVYLVVIVKNLFYYGAFLTTQYQAKIAVVRLRQLLLEKCFTFNKQFFDNHTAAYLQSVLTKSTDVIESQFRLFQELVIQILLLVSYLFLMLRISWKLTLVSLIVFPLINLVVRKIVTQVRAASRQFSKFSLKVNEKIANILYGMPVIKGFVKEQHELEQFNKVSNEEIEQSFKVQKLVSLISPLEDLGTTTGLLIVALVLAYLVKIGAGVTASEAFVFFYLAIKLLPSFTTINNFKLGMATAINSISDIEYILNSSDGFITQSGSKKFDGLQREIAIKHLTFTYDNTENATLKNISCTILKGKVTAIVGPTGSGKSTLMNLLLRLYDCPPHTIFIDGTDIREFDISSVRNAIAHIQQESILFNASLKHNLLYANHSLEETVLSDIAQKVQLAETINALPQKYDTEVGDRGTKLSGGERQRVSIARALLKSPDILIMDEATSALDSQTELAINEYIYNETKGKTVIIIAHRLSTIKHADQILYLEKGEIKEQGTLEELLKKEGAFAKQWQAQKI